MHRPMLTATCGRTRLYIKSVLRVAGCSHRRPAATHAVRSRQSRIVAHNLTTTTTTTTTTRVSSSVPSSHCRQRTRGHSSQSSNGDGDNTLRPTGGSSGSERSVLFLSSTLWPEPSSSAAGVRTTSLLRHFAGTGSGSNDNNGSKNHEPPLFDAVHYGGGAPRPSPSSSTASTAESSSLAEHLERLSSEGGIKLHDVPANRTARMANFLSLPQFDGLSAVVFDRFFAEEAYSHQIRRWKPDALRVLDMQDFHALRMARQALVEGWNEHDEQHGGWMTDELMDDVMGCVPSHCSPGGAAVEAEAVQQAEAAHARAGTVRANQKGKRGKNYRDALLRELASIHRSDLTLVCSPRERSLLVDAFDVNPDKLCPAPFFVDDVEPTPSYTNDECIAIKDCYDAPLRQFDYRTDFAVLGGYRHPPNVDCVRWLRAEVWPRIRARLARAKVHVWGSYPPHRILSLHDPRNGFLVKGRLDGDVGGELVKRRVLLAPLRYGAGIKGKVCDAWRFGCPVVTTPVGAEGTTSTMFGGGGDDGGGGGSCGDVVLRRCTVRGGSLDDGNGGGGGDGGGYEHIDDAGWGGLIGTDAEALSQCAVRLYSDRSLWDATRSNARRLLRTLFDRERNLTVVDRAVRDAMDNLDDRRRADHAGAVLWHHSVRSAEYFSRWIELKETGTTGGVS